MNRMISARILEPQVWNEVVSILLDPENLQQGYEAAQEQSAGVLARHHRHLETLRRNRLKLERAMRNLTQAYIDPDIGMAKTEYLEQKGRIESDLRTVASEIAAVELELSHMPTPSELEEIEVFLAEVRQALGEEAELDKREKRKILEMLEIQVLISGDGSFSLEGWFTSSTGFQRP